MKRDFTNIHDLIKAMSLLIDIIPQKVENRREKFKGDSISRSAPFRIVNIGNSNSVSLMDYITSLEKALGKVAKRNFLKMQKGDMEETLSNVDLLETLTGFRPQVSLDNGIIEFVQWYKSYYT